MNDAEIDHMVRLILAKKAALVPVELPSRDEIRLALGEVSPQGMRDIAAYHRWLTYRGVGDAR